MNGESRRLQKDREQADEQKRQQNKANRQEQYDPMVNAETYDRYRRTLLSEGFSGAGNYWYRGGRRYTLHGALAVNRWRRMTVTIEARMDRFAKALQQAGRAARRAEIVLYLKLYKPAAYKNLPNVRYYRLQKRPMLTA